MRLAVLILANLKRFLRDRQSVLILTGFPLLIVAGIYWGFSPNQIDTPIGTIENTGDFNYSEFEEKTSDFATLERYEELDECLGDLKNYRIYACTVFESEDGNVVIRVYYDNTREVIDQNIVNEMKEISDEMQLDYVQETASRFINRSEELSETFKTFGERLNETIEEIEASRNNTQDRIDQLEESKTNLENNKAGLETGTVEEIGESSREFGAEIEVELEALAGILRQIENTTENQTKRVSKANNRVSRIGNLTSGYVEGVGNELEELNESFEEIRGIQDSRQDYSSQLEQSIGRAENTSRKLESYLSRFKNARDNVNSLAATYSEISELDPENLSRGVKRNEERVYSGETSESGLRVMKTIYSTLLILVGLFVSLLVALFVTLNDINSQARKRLDVTPGTFFAEYLSIYLASLLIISIPVTAVLLIGQTLFDLPIFSNIEKVAVILFLFCSSVINMSMLTAYLIRKKGITLLVGSFILVFMIFFSGFVMPLQMMDTLVRNIASPLPGNVAQKAFDSAVLYGQGFGDISSKLQWLGFWTILFSSAGIYVKSGKRYVSRYLKILFG